MAPNKYIKEVEETLSRLSTKQAAGTEKLKGYLGTKHSVLGLSSTEQKQICKNGFSFYSEDKEKVFRVFDTVYKISRVHETKSQALLYLDLHYKHIPLEVQLELLPGWVQHVDNWAHSDYLSKFLTRIVEHPSTQKEMMRILKTWNGSSNPWERRQSLVALFYYARCKDTHISFDTSARFLKPLLNDPDYYVQKAVGWTLRECYNVYPKETYDLMTRHYRQITSIAFTAAIEKMSDEKKVQLKKLRKGHA